MAGALISVETASSPARRGLVRSRSTTCRRVGSASAESVTSSSVMAVSMLPPRRSTRAVAGAFAARDVQAVAGLTHDRPMPHALRDDARVAGLERHDPLAAFLLEHDVDRARQEAHELVPGRMHLPVVPVVRVVEGADEPAPVELGPVVDRLPERV